MGSGLDCTHDCAAYVLGAMSEHEAAAFRRHLATCPDCRDSVDALEGTVETLPMLAVTVEPPPGLRERVMAEVRADPRTSVRTARRPSARAGVTQRLAKPVPKLGLAGFGALMVAGIITVVMTVKPASTQVIRAQVAFQPGAAVMRVAGNHGQLYVEGMPQPPAGKIYEVWLKHGTATPSPTNVLFEPVADGDVEVGIPGDLSGVTQVMVTVEPDGGRSTPTGTPVIIANLD